MSHHKGQGVPEITLTLSWTNFLLDQPFKYSYFSLKQLNSFEFLQNDVKEPKCPAQPHHPAL
jgi:hypothetical protein